MSFKFNQRKEPCIIIDDYNPLGITMEDVKALEALLKDSDIPVAVAKLPLSKYDIEWEKVWEEE